MYWRRCVPRGCFPAAFREGIHAHSSPDNTILYTRNHTPIDAIADAIRKDLERTGRAHSVLYALAGHFITGIAIGLGVAVGLAIAS